MRRSFSVQKKSGGMQSDDGQRLYGEAAERRRADERREAESALMESLGRRPDRRVFKLSKKKKRRGETEKPPCQLPVCHRAREVVCSVTQSLISAQWEVVISSGSEPCALSKYPLGG